MLNEPTLGRALVQSPDFAVRSDMFIPCDSLLDLPEKAVQFGTGAFLRGFVDFFLDRANRHGCFNGRIVAIGSTGSGRDQLLNDQDGLYTLSIQGVEQGKSSEQHTIISSVSRALSATGEWDKVLECARNPSLEIIFSNTTEVGITMDEDDAAELNPPRSFPGKLTRFLYVRACAFAFEPAAGLVVVPCELIEDNGDRLREIVLALAERWELGREFIGWIRSSVPFCNTLVDRIVTGTPTGEQATRLHEVLGYEDEMLTVCEVYKLFAIEADSALRSRLSFASEAGVVVASDITPYRERKVRLLNGTHTVCVPAAILCGCETVREALEHDVVGPFIRATLFDDIVPSVDVPGAESFAHDVLDRFANPYINHTLLDITLQETMKMRVRVVPSILEFIARRGHVPQSLAFGFAAYLEFMRGQFQQGRRRAGLYVPADDQAEYISALWREHECESEAGVTAVVETVCSDSSLWGADLAKVTGFTEAVSRHLTRIRQSGTLAALGAHMAGIRVCN